MKKYQSHSISKMNLLGFVCLFCLCFQSLNLSAQKKVDVALKNLLDSEFMIKYKDMKTEVEATAMHFKSIQSQFSLKEIMQVRRSYNTTIYHFNQVLEDIKKDMLDRKKMRSISKIPEDYAKSLELDMYELANTHAAKFHQVVSDITQDEVDGSAFLITLTQIFGLTNTIVSQITRMVQSSRQYSESYLNDNLMNPYQIPDWENVGGDNQHDFQDEQGQEFYDEYEERYPDHFQHNKKKGWK